MARKAVAAAFVLAALVAGGCGSSEVAEPEEPKATVQLIGEEIEDIYSASAMVIKGSCLAMSVDGLRLEAVSEGTPRAKWATHIYEAQGQITDMIVHSSRELTEEEMTALANRIERAEAPIVKRLEDLEAEDEAEDDWSGHEG